MGHLQFLKQWRTMPQTNLGDLVLLLSKCYIYILLFFLIAIQLYSTSGAGPKGARDNDYPVAMNIKTCK